MNLIDSFGHKTQELVDFGLPTNESCRRQIFADAVWLNETVKNFKGSETLDNALIALTIRSIRDSAYRVNRDWNGKFLRDRKDIAPVVDGNALLIFEEIQVIADRVLATMECDFSADAFSVDELERKVSGTEIGSIVIQQKDFFAMTSKSVLKRGVDALSGYHAILYLAYISQIPGFMVGARDIVEALKPPKKTAVDQYPEHFIAVFVTKRMLELNNLRKEVPIKLVIDRSALSRYRLKSTLKKPKSHNSQTHTPSSGSILLEELGAMLPSVPTSKVIAEILSSIKAKKS